MGAMAGRIPPAAAMLIPALDLPGRRWPEEYNGSLFMNNIHGARINRDLLSSERLGLRRVACA